MDPNHETFEPGPVSRWRLKKGALILLALVLLSGGGAWYVLANKKAPIQLRTTPVTRGELLEAISATGTVEPEEVVDVGAQVAGQIMGFGQDADGKQVDYGSSVKKGTILARIDDEVYAADEARARAQLQASQAGLQKAQADLAALKARLRQAERDWQRARKLGPSEALSQASYDAYQSAFESARANLAVGEAAVLQAKAAVAQDQALLAKAKRNLGYCTITSPVEGVIIDRRVNIGQTVVASLNAPSLFLIAKDLRRMQVWVAVNEADIGKIRPGQPVSFTVDAFPGETFRGQVGKVRLNASMTQNVVTYTVEIITDNTSGRLLPYLSANVQFEVRRLKDALLVPNAALRWRPSAGMAIAAPARKPQPAQGKEATNAKPAAPSAGVTGRGLVWIPDGQKVKPVRVAVLASDGNFTAVRSKVLTADTPVVVGLEESKARRSNESSNPFAPKFPGRSSKRQR